MLSAAAEPNRPDPATGLRIGDSSISLPVRVARHGVPILPQAGFSRLN
jgi:hypothetical protein